MNRNYYEYPNTRWVIFKINTGLWLAFFFLLFPVIMTGKDELFYLESSQLISAM
jgi:hypothetical protein